MLWAGTDEVGRGCLAGPVVAAAVAWHPDTPPTYITELADSKVLSPKKRYTLALKLVSDTAVLFGIGWCDAKEVDQYNIGVASKLAMQRSLYALGIDKLAGVYVDGNQPITIACAQEVVIKGDAKIPQISAASIIAKVFRDQWMANLHEQYPYYGWHVNKGYGTPDHLIALEKQGPSPQHRYSFAPVAQQSLHFE